MTIIMVLPLRPSLFKYLKSCIYHYKLFNNLSWTALH